MYCCLEMAGPEGQSSSAGAAIKGLNRVEEAVSCFTLIRLKGNCNVVTCFSRNSYVLGIVFPCLGPTCFLTKPNQSGIKLAIIMHHEFDHAVKCMLWPAYKL